MSPNDRARAKQIERSLMTFGNEVRPLPGINSKAARECLVAQIIDSLRRIEFVQGLYSRPIDQRRAQPNDPLFDPLRAAAFYTAAGNRDEAWWLIFLATHFGKHLRGGWSLTASVYGGLGQRLWTWQEATVARQEMANWVTLHEQQIRSAPRVCGFSNHRKYESISSTPRVIQTYIDWVLSYGSHAGLLAHAQQEVGQNPAELFDFLYKHTPVHRFGRLAKFDFLTMLGKLGLAPIEPGKTYMSGATGPRPGAQLLFNGNPNAAAAPADLDEWLADLGVQAGLSMQVLEDALCNWQKTPNKYKLFRG